MSYEGKGTGAQKAIAVTKDGRSIRQSTIGGFETHPTLTIYTQNGNEGARFNFFRAFPVSYNIAGVNVAGTDLAFEELELACEKFVRVI